MIAVRMIAAFMVFEAAINLMSYVEIRGDYVTNKLALGMLSDALMEKCYGLGYEVEDCPPPKPFKDYNQWLQQAKKCFTAFTPKREMAR